MKNIALGVCLKINTIGFALWCYTTVLTCAFMIYLIFYAQDLRAYTYISGKSLISMLQPLHACMTNLQLGLSGDVSNKVKMHYLFDSCPGLDGHYYVCDNCRAQNSNINTHTDWHLLE